MIKVKKQFNLFCPKCGEFLAAKWKEESEDEFITYCDCCGLYINISQVSYKFNEVKEYEKEATSFRIYVEER